MNLKIHPADGNHLPITEITDISDISSSLTDVFLSLGLTTNLIYVGQLVDDNCHVEFSKYDCLVQVRLRRSLKLDAFFHLIYVSKSLFAFHFL